MPPPRSRRTGQSRRAQYGRFISYVVAVGGVLISLLLLLLSVIDPRGFAAIKGAALDATTPISSAGRSVLRSVTDFGQSIGDYFEAGRQNGGSFTGKRRLRDPFFISGRAARKGPHPHAGFGGTFDRGFTICGRKIRGGESGT